MSNRSQLPNPTASTASMLDRASALAPSRVRYQVVGLTVLLAMVTYLDRVAISKLAPDIMGDLHLVRFHHRDRRGVQLRHDAARAISVRYGRGWRVAVRRAIVLSLDPPEGPRHDSGHFFRRGHLAGGLTPLAIVALQPVLALAADFRVLRERRVPPGLEPEAATPVGPRARVARAEDSRLRINEIPRGIDGTPPRSATD